MNVYIYQAALLCEDCGKVQCQALIDAGKAPANPDDEYTYDTDDYPKGPYGDGGGEADCAQHCDHCNTFLENPLTSHGAENVAESLVSGFLRDDGSPDVLREWFAFYRDDVRELVEEMMMEEFDNWSKNQVSVKA